MGMTVVTPPARTETVTGTITASHQDVVVEVGEAAAGTEMENAGVATCGPGRHRYENVFLLSLSLISSAKTKGCFANA